MDIYPPATEQSSERWKIITKICIKCGQPFECRSTARRTRWCPECSNIRFTHSIAHWLKREVIKRDGNKCRYCGKEVTREDLRFDHVIPFSSGGLTELDNLVVSCCLCNHIKAARTPEQAGMALMETANGR